MTAIAAVTLIVGFDNQAFLPFPKGYDAYGHMSKVRYLVDFFPNTDWNSEWYSGQLFSEGSFPPLFHYLAAALVGWFGLSLETALVAIAAASFVVIACTLYGLVRVVTGSIFAGVIAALALVSTNAFWAYILLGGLYPRILGMAFLGLLAFFAALHFKTGSRAAYAGAVLSLAATLSSHLLLGAIGVALAALLVAAFSSTRLLDGGRLLVPAALLVAYFYLPYVAGLSRPGPVPVFTRDYSPIPVAAVLTLTPSELEAISVAVVATGVLLPAAVFFRRGLAVPAFARRLMPPLALGGVAALSYALVGLPPPHLFIYNFQPGQALFFAAWFLAALLGTALSVAAAPRVPRVVLPLVTLGLLGAVAVGPTRLAAGVIDADSPAKHQLQGALHVDASDMQHRIGVSADAESDWIDARYDVPQTRGYQQQGVVDASWQYWFENRLWSAGANIDERDFLLDWYAVRAFSGGPVASTFAMRPDVYAPQDESRQTFDFVDASPILSAVTTRSALVIGADAAYRHFVEALAPSGFDSHSLVPVRGGDYLDDHSVAELRQFDMLVLYGYRAHDLAASFRMLDAYVAGGGSVLIEANNSPLESAGAAPAPIPGTSIQTARLRGDWGLSTASSPITAGITFRDFDPPVFNGGPWGISYMPASTMAPWASPVLLSGGRPVVVAGMMGRGRVVWSGMNLPYHAATTRNREESRLLANEIDWAAPSEAAAVAYQAQFVNPEMRSVVVESPATGVLFKENDVANWTATVNGRPAAIYHAGPDFMYVTLGPATTIPARVVFTFTRTTLEWAGDAISLVALIGGAAWVVRSATAGFRRRRKQGDSPDYRTISSS